MIDLPFLDEIARPSPTRILLLVVDGLGGAPHPDTGKTELETARLPNLDSLAGESACGLTTPVIPGITPGSGPGHMALFGYDPVKYLMGRGVLEALGSGIEMASSDVAARGNLCTIDEGGLITDRRAGRIPTADSTPLVELLDGIEVPGVEVSTYPVQDYRFVLLLRGESLSDAITGTDPQVEGAAPLESQPLGEDARKTAEAVNRFAASARAVLAGQKRANMVVLRGFSGVPILPDFGAGYKLNPAAIAAYPMYRGLAHLVGMKIIPAGGDFDAELDALEAVSHEHDFIFLHYKPADAAGEDGDFDAKVRRLEEMDARIPRLLATEPDVLVVAGDHSTPAIMAGHSWHPVPLLIRSRYTRGEGVGQFSERAFRGGSLGSLAAQNVMLLAMAHAEKLNKYGP